MLTRELQFKFISLNKLNGLLGKIARHSLAPFFHRIFRHKWLILAQGASAENPHETIHEHVGMHLPNYTD
jgi:hypothetical protein